MRKPAATLFATVLFTTAALLSTASPAQANPYECSTGTDYSPTRYWSYCAYGSNRHLVVIRFTHPNPQVAYSWTEYGPCVPAGQRSEHTPNSTAAANTQVFSGRC
ncbi:hypothetical protein [Streptosporangium carneum]|nr:hypothetical protein [Streptosporangium carneum]